MRRISGILVGVLTLFSWALAQDEAPLFASDEPLRIQIVGPLNELVRAAANSTDPYPASLRVMGDAPEAHAIEVSARGNSRRNRRVCQFPPLRVRFNDKPEDGTAFAGEKSLKLVTHCRSSVRYQQYYFREYAAYKLLNALTPVSLKVRQAEIEYIDEASQELIIKRYGFFIEDIDDAAKRNGMKELTVDKIGFYVLNNEAAARYALFQYMIGNLDWSMLAAAGDDDCCHNTKLLGEKDDVLENIVPVPYDFDYSGLVDTPYALPPEGLPVRNVRMRLYRGFCAHNDEAKAVAAEMTQKQGELLGVFDRVRGLDAKNNKSARKYLENFFDEIGDPQKLDKLLTTRCRAS